VLSFSSLGQENEASSEVDARLRSKVGRKSGMREGGEERKAHLLDTRKGRAKPTEEEKRRKKESQLLHEERRNEKRKGREGGWVWGFLRNKEERFVYRVIKTVELLNYCLCCSSGKRDRVAREGRGGERDANETKRGKKDEKRKSERSPFFYRRRRKGRRGKERRKRWEEGGVSKKKFSFSFVRTNDRRKKKE